MSLPEVAENPFQDVASSKQDETDVIPNEIWDKVAIHLEVPDLSNFRLVSRAFNTATDPRTLRVMCVTLREQHQCMEEVIPPSELLRLSGVVKSLRLNISHWKNFPHWPFAWNLLCHTGRPIRSRGNDGRFVSQDHYPSCDLFKSFLGTLDELHIALQDSNKARKISPKEISYYTGVPPESFLEAATNIGVFSLSEERLFYPTLVPHGLGCLLGAWCWTALQDLSFHAFQVRGCGDLMHAFKIFHKTLRKLTLSRIDIYGQGGEQNEAWDTLCRELRATMNLERLTLLHVYFGIRYDPKTMYHDPGTLPLMLTAVGKAFGHAIKNVNHAPVVTAGSLRQVKRARRLDEITASWLREGGIQQLIWS